jgi:hypothetical protein
MKGSVPSNPPIPAHPCSCENRLTFITALPAGIVLADKPQDCSAGTRIALPQRTHGVASDRAKRGRCTFRPSKSAACLTVSS